MIHCLQSTQISRIGHKQKPTPTPSQKFQPNFSGKGQEISKGAAVAQSGYWDEVRRSLPNHRRKLERLPVAAERATGRGSIHGLSFKSRTGDRTHEKHISFVVKYTEYKTKTLQEHASCTSNCSIFVGHLSEIASFGIALFRASRNTSANHLPNEKREMFVSRRADFCWKETTQQFYYTMFFSEISHTTLKNIFAP